MKTKKRLFQLSVLIGIASFFIAGPLITEAAPVTAWPKDIGIGTKPIESGTYSAAVGMSKVIAKYIKGIAAHAAPFGSESAYVRAMLAGEIQMCINTSVFAYHAPKGLLIFAGAPTVQLRDLAVGEIYYIPLLVRPGSGIETPSDIKGKKCMFNFAGSLIQGLAYKAKLQAYGLTEKDITLLPFGTLGEVVAALREGRTDCAIFPFTKGSSFLQELSLEGKVKLVGDTDDVLKNIYKTSPYFPAEVIPARTFKGQEKEIKCPIVATHLGIDKRLPDDLAFAIIAALYDHFDELVSYYRPLEEYALPKAISPASLIIPVHPGAIKYYKNRGLWKDAHEKKNKELIAEEVGKGK